MDERILPPLPSGARTAGKPSLESDFWAGLFLDLTLRIEWPEQALDARRARGDRLQLDVLCP